MKHTLFLLMLAVPSVAFAQQKNDVKPLPNQATILQILDVQKALQGSVNMRGFTLIKPAMLYRNLADTIKGKPALRLSAGENVIIQKQIGH